jgi:hypothetical protein
MPLSNEQISTLLGMVETASPDELACDGCSEQIAEFAELRLTDCEIPDALKTVEGHLDQCICCKDEFVALLAALRDLA